MHWQRKVQKLSLSLWWTNQFLILSRKLVLRRRWSQTRSHRRRLRPHHLLRSQLVFCHLLCRFRGRAKVKSTTTLPSQLALSCIVFCPNEVNRPKILCSLFLSHHVKQALDCSCSYFCLLLFLCFHLGEFSEQVGLNVMRWKNDLKGSN